MRIKIINPSGKILKFLAAWKADEGYVETCHSETCTHGSHEAGYDLFEYELPEVVAKYVEGKIHTIDGDVHSHDQNVWKYTPTERSLRNYDSEVVVDCRRVMKNTRRAIEVLTKICPFNLAERREYFFELAGQACRELVSGAHHPESTWKLQDNLNNLLDELEAKLERERDWEKDSFFAQAQWEGLNRLKINP